MTGSSLPEHELMTQEMPSTAREQTPQNFNRNVSRLLHRAATGIAIGVIGLGAFAEAVDQSDASPTPDIPVTLYTPLPKQDHPNSSKDIEPQGKSSEITHKELNSKDCTSLRRRANDIYMGIACAQDGAESEVVDSSTLQKGWVYSAISVGGIYKCAFVKAGVLPEMPHHPKIAAACVAFYDSLVNKRFEFFEDWNCSEESPCRSGTPPREKTEQCKDTDVIWGNFATDDPSPFNVLGTGGGGFSTTLPNKINLALSYRVQVRQGSDDGKAIVVRDTNNTPTLDWGLEHDDCIRKADRHDGTPVR